MTRRFEYIGGTSAKFWQIRIGGTTVDVRYGRLGADGQSLNKTFPDSATAQKHAEKLIAEKLAKDYREVAAACVPGPASAS